eukprot:scaffold34685_cov183-Amphora_coffeaeformis.AAC.8
MIHSNPSTRADTDYRIGRCEGNEKGTTTTTTTTTTRVVVVAAVPYCSFLGVLPGSSHTSHKRITGSVRQPCGCAGRSAIISSFSRFSSFRSTLFSFLDYVRAFQWRQTER